MRSWVKHPDCNHRGSITQPRSMRSTRQCQSALKRTAHTHGEGIGRYIEDLTGLGADAALKSSQQLVATPAVGTFAAYQHDWNTKLRSTVTYGYVNLENQASQVPTLFHQSHYAAGNLIWNPVGNFDFGAEYLYGELEAKDGDKGYGSRIQVSMKYDFYKW
jgi:hypothetical protein